MAIGGDLPGARNFVEKPRAGVAPEILGGAWRDAKGAGGVFVGQADEVAQLDQFGLNLIFGGEFVQRLVDGEQFVIALRCGDVQPGHVNALLAATVAHGLFAAGAFDQDAPHGFRRCCEEVCAVRKFWGVVACQPQPGFMHQGGGLERVASRFARHLDGGQFAEFGINQWQKFPGGRGISVVNLFEDLGDLIDGGELTTLSLKIQ